MRSRPNVRADTLRSCHCLQSCWGKSETPSTATVATMPRHGTPVAIVPGVSFCGWYLLFFAPVASRGDGPGGKKTGLAGCGNCDRTGIYAAQPQKGLTMITKRKLDNAFHGTTVKVRLPENISDTDALAWLDQYRPHTARRVRKALCGIRGCKCGYIRPW